MTNPDLTHQAMIALDAGLAQIADRYTDSLFLADEDPITFGGGHFVLYPADHNGSRFTVEELYIGSVWDDPERIPSSWAWRDEHRLPSPDGGRIWVASSEGEVPASRVMHLVARAEGWARANDFLTARAAALDRDTSHPSPTTATARFEHRPP